MAREEELDQEEANYWETIKGLRSFCGVEPAAKI